MPARWWARRPGAYGGAGGGWPAYRHIDPVRLASRVANPKVIDARGTLTADDWRDAGWIYRALGRP